MQAHALDDAFDLPGAAGQADTGTGATHLAGALAPRCWRVLVVDDEPSIREVLCDVLHDEGYAVDEAEHGAAALDAVATHAPDVILLDMRMPILDGWGFAREYRTRPGPHAPIIVMSAAMNASAWAAEVAAAGVVPKPFELEALLAAVEQLCPAALPPYLAVCTAGASN